MALSALIQLGVLHVTGFNGLFLLLPGIFASGIIFDHGSAFFATLIGLAIAVYITASDQTGASAYELAIPIILFGLTGSAIAFLSEAVRNAMERLVRAEKSKDVLLRELDHRTKNNMMSIASLLRLQARVAFRSWRNDLLSAYPKRKKLGR